MATKQVNMHEAKSRLSELGELAWKGEKVVIAKAGKPYLDLLPHRQERRERKPGLLKGKIRIAADFDATSPELIAAFEGRS
jgi:antitoxin (DNA-binding transcriptional repressor) of toxin-antitoxin stability system